MTARNGTVFVKVFAEIKENFGSFEIDLLASNINTKCERYVLWHKDTEAIAVDEFTLSWKNIFFYAFPPFSMILRMLKKIQIDEAKGLVVVLIWPTQPWYPTLESLMVSKL